MAKLDFKDFMSVDYAPGMPDLVKKNAKKRKSDDGAGSNAEYSSTNPPNVEEALTATQRRARARLMKRYKSRIARGQERAKKRMASQETLEKRARKAARTALFKKLSKDIPKDELTFQRRQEIEKRMEKMKGRIDKLAKKLLPQVRKTERERRQSMRSNND